MSGRFVVLGVARSRQSWFSELARWSTTGAAPIEFVKCLTVDETRAVLGSGRGVSAVLVDAGVPRVDRDLIAEAAESGAATIVVSDGRPSRDWESLGCAAVLHHHFGRDELVDTLQRCAHPVDSQLRRPARSLIGPPPERRCTFIGVTGPGGTGASTVAMALAQAIASDRPDTTVALVDARHRGDLAMYHDVGDVIPGIPELVEAHRVDQPDPEQIRQLLFEIVERRYDLMIGMRRPRDWSGMRPRSVEAAIEGLGRAYDVVVVDHEADLDGEAETGSMDVEDRNALARAVVSRADLLVVVGAPGLKGVNDLVRLVGEAAEHGMPLDRVQPVVNRAGRSPAGRAALTSTIAELTLPAEGDSPGPAPPLFLRSERSQEATHRSAARLPESMCRPLGRVVRRLLLDLGHRPEQRVRSGFDDHGVAVAPGELGTRFDHRSTSRTA